MAVRVEPLREADIPASLDICNQYVFHTSVSLEEQALTLAQYRQRVEEVLRAYPFIVARRLPACACEQPAADAHRGAGPRAGHCQYHLHHHRQQRALLRLP